ncbi:hypothetical protein [Mycobacterium vicinigordonae]|uniref:hypothetical protein n=1 Tax=Mycobacterium vicinigordonae TaxID=1719132 RepID=UPI001FEBD63B|nr:hypothetical protein [Mycobacterium vicinigordonae]
MGFEVPEFGDDLGAVVDGLAAVAAAIVAADGNRITVEDCRISTWARLWGKRIALFSPGMLVTALAAECTARVASAEQAAPGTPPNRPHPPGGRRGTSRKQPAPKLIGAT